MTSPSFAPMLEHFFTHRLMQQRQASPHTISSYRDTFRQFLKFAQRELQKPPSSFDFKEIDAPLIVAFLDSLEKNHGLSVRSRNLRLTALHSFFRYAAFESPAHAAQIQRVLAIPSKRFTRTLVSFLTREEVDALLAAPDLQTWSGRRDHAFILLAVQTGLRLSEITSLTNEEVILGNRRPRTRDRQRAQGALYSYCKINTCSSEGVDARTTTRRMQYIVSQCKRTTSQRSWSAILAE